MKSEPELNLYKNIYHNPAQNPDIPRVLFVCSVGMLRSPTAAAMAVKLGLNARSCGVDKDALIQLTPRLITWADTVVFMHNDVYARAVHSIEDINLLSMMKDQQVIWNIDDEYDYMNSWLSVHLRHKIIELMEFIK